jgi:hypothetical protein
MISGSNLTPEGGETRVEQASELGPFPGTLIQQHPEFSLGA